MTEYLLSVNRKLQIKNDKNVFHQILVNTLPFTARLEI